MNEKKNVNILIPLESGCLSNSLQQFCDFMSSCVGNDCRLKLLVDRGNGINLTSSCSILADHLDVDSYICLYLLRMTKCLHDFGLYFSIVASSFLKDIICYASLQGLTFSDVICYIRQLKESTISLLNSPDFKRKIDLGDTKNILQLVNSLIYCKPIIKSHSKLINLLSFKIVKTFLSSVTESKIQYEHLLIITEEGAENYFTFQGVILPYNEQNKFISNMFSNAYVGESKMLIFVSLNFSQFNLVFNLINHFFDILKLVIANGVRIIVCQQLVDEKVKLFLRRKKVLLFERVGEFMIQTLEYLTSAVPLLEINKLNLDDLKQLTGTVTHIKLVTCGVRKYILLQREHSSVATLLVQNRMLGGQNEMKVVLKQCIKSLGLLLASPFVVPGGGSFEVAYKYSITNSLEKNKQMDYFRKSFCQCLFRAVGSCQCLSNDMHLLHIKETESQEISNCKRIHTDKFGYQLSDCTSGQIFNGTNPFAEQCFVHDESFVFDCYETKIRALYHVFDTVINIFEIGLIVKR